VRRATCDVLGANGADVLRAGRADVPRAHVHVRTSSTQHVRTSSTQHVRTSSTWHVARRTSHVCLLLAALAVSAAAQGSLTLEDAIALAMKESARLAELEARQAGGGGR
jgi:hypothetical protein